jgi:hypothetical protein
VRSQAERGILTTKFNRESSLAIIRYAVLRRGARDDRTSSRTVVYLEAIILKSPLRWESRNLWTSVFVEFIILAFRNELAGRRVVSTSLECTLSTSVAPLVRNRPYHWPIWISLERNQKHSSFLPSADASSTLNTLLFDLILLTFHSLPSLEN